jgi:Nitroreductase family
MGKAPPRNAAQGFRSIPLPPPNRDGGRSVLASLRLRRTERSIGPKKVPRKTLSNLLWAAAGINRRKGPFGMPGRTAASASNSQEVDLYVLLREGVYLYEPSLHRLAPVAAGDLRRLAIGRGQAPAGSKAPVRLVYVANLEKFKRAGFQEPGLWDREVQKAYYHVDTGMMAGNAYLFAASQGLACWFHNCDQRGLAARLRLRPSQLALFGQTFGYPSP